jgi:hypothetical protein
MSLVPRPAALRAPSVAAAVATALVTTALLAACGGRGGDDVKVELPGGRSAPAPARVAGAGDETGSARIPEPPLAPGDVGIASRDSILLLRLAGDTVRMRLGPRFVDSVSQSVRRELAESAQDDSGDATGIGATVLRGVADVVGKAMGAMGSVVKIPVAQLTGVRYENGTIRIETRSGRTRFETDRSDPSEGATFAREDAERFIAAVERRRQEVAARERR